MNTNKAEEVVVVPEHTVKRIIEMLKPSDCSWCEDEFEAVGEHKEHHIHKTLCPIGELENLLKPKVKNG